MTRLNYLVRDPISFVGFPWRTTATFVRGRVFAMLYRSMCAIHAHVKYTSCPSHSHARRGLDVGCRWKETLKRALCMQYMLTYHTHLFWNKHTRRGFFCETNTHTERIGKTGVTADRDRGIVTFNFSPRNLTQVTSAMKPGQCMI